MTTASSARRSPRATEIAPPRPRARANTERNGSGAIEARADHTAPKRPGRATPLLLEPRLDLGDPEAEPAADSEPGDLAALEPVDDRARCEAEELAELAGGEEAFTH